MKNNTDTLPDFSRKSVNSMSSSELNLEVILAHFTFLTTLMAWIGNEGKRLLLQEGNLTHGEWGQLFQRVFDLWNDIGERKSVSVLFAITVAKGIQSLKGYLQNWPSELRKVAYHQDSTAWQWYCAISYQLEPGARLGIGSHYCKIEESRRLIESLVPIVQAFQNDQVLEDLARSRFPGDETSQQYFIKEHKNW